MDREALELTTTPSATESHLMRHKTVDDTSHVYFSHRELDAMPEPLANLVKAVAIVSSDYGEETHFAFEPAQWSAVADVIFHWHQPHDLTPSLN